MDEEIYCLITEGIGKTIFKYRSYFHSRISGGVRDVLVLDNMRKDLTISLDEEHIDELLEIAENQSTTLSALIRDIISSYVQAVQQGMTPSFQEMVGEARDVPRSSSCPPELSVTIARHGALITELERRITLLESNTHVSAPVFPSVLPTAISNTMALTSPATHVSVTGVIDSDLPPAGNLSEEALVKTSRQPVAPVMDAMEMGSMKVRPDKEYTQTEAAVALGVSVSTMRKYIKENKISARKVGRSWLIHGRDILTHQSGT
ncbi:helix-turn-helix domain-containing protein [Methanospirillum purgamenti]|nr:helix-turn-helix domain-containing protein [Methanospirillum hungatei]MDX8550395.1 helix-turn-helix domain-containing protein [Methanospirillum hungatei]